jgi:hypothetical protein
MLFSYSSGGQKFKIKVPAELYFFGILGENPAFVSSSFRWFQAFLDSEELQFLLHLYMPFYTCL